MLVPGCLLLNQPIQAFLLQHLLIWSKSPPFLQGKYDKLNLSFVPQVRTLDWFDDLFVCFLTYPWYSQVFSPNTKVQKCWQSFYLASSKFNFSLHIVSQRIPTVCTFLIFICINTLSHLNIASKVFITALRSAILQICMN